MHSLVLLPFLVALLAPASAPGSSQGDLGDIDFPNSGSSEAQPYFRRGVLLLHSFEYEDSRLEFLKTQEIDPGFALAYWGEAMTYNHPLWRQQDKEKARAALLKLGKTPGQRLEKAPTGREKGYLWALDELYCQEEKSTCDWRYSSVMQKLSAAYPDDLEAASFYALSVLGTARGERSYRTYMRAAAIAEEVFARNPRHPGAAHYLIHSYDEPIHAPLGLRAARVYAEIAPAAPHALHMPSHIFMALGHWQKSVDSNTASAQAALDKGRPGNAYHALWWKHYSLLQLGRFEEAGRTLQQVNDLAASHPSPSARRTSAYLRASQIIETRDWDSNLLEDFDVSDLRVKARATVLFARGMQLIHQSLPDQALRLVRKIKHLPKPDEGPASDEQAVQIMARELQAFLLLLLDQKRQALNLANQAIHLQIQRSAEFGPPLPIKPAFEMLGDVLFAVGQPEDAQQAYAESLRRNPGRSLSLMGMASAAEAAGDQHSVADAVRALQENWSQGDADLPALPEVPPEDADSRDSEAEETQPQARQLGTISNFSSIQGQIFFGGQPSAEDLEALEQLGVRTIISLRSAEEMESLGFDEKRAVQEDGMDFLHFPVSGDDPPGDERLAGLFDLLEDASAHPIFLHCASSNRSGFVWALFRGLRGGLETEEAIREGEGAGLRSVRLKEQARQALSRAMGERDH